MSIWSYQLVLKGKSGADPGPNYDPFAGAERSKIFEVIFVSPWRESETKGSLFPASASASGVSVGIVAHVG